MALSAIAVHRGEASVGGFVAVNVWVINLFAPLNFLGTVYNALITALVDLQNLSELLAQKPNVVDPDPPATHPGAAGEGGLAVTFKDVRFRYARPRRGLPSRPSPPPRRGISDVAAAAPPADYPTARPASAEISPPRRCRRPRAERPPAGTAKSTTSGRSNF